MLSTIFVVLGAVASTTIASTTCNEADEGAMLQLANRLAIKKNPDVVLQDTATPDDASLLQGVQDDEATLVQGVQEIEANQAEDKSGGELGDEYDCRLSAYWEYGNCGCGGNDLNQGWCGGVRSGDCPDTIETSICPSGTAYLAEWHPKPYDGTGHAGRGHAGHLVRDGCEYIWHAQYACQVDTPPPETEAEAEMEAEADADEQFFHNAVGFENAIGDFATDDDVTGARGNFLRRVDCASRVVRAHVQGGSCGDATVQFRIDDDAAEYFRSGTQGPGAGWTHLTDVTVVSGEVAHLPDTLFTGHGWNRGWMLCTFQPGQEAPSGRVTPSWCFANSYRGGLGRHDSERVASNRLQVSETVSRGGWDYCNSNRLQGGETVTLECVA